MIQTVEALIDRDGGVFLMQPIALPAMRGAIVTILDQEANFGAFATAMLSESALAVD
jgi:hypothetical protein